MKPQRFYNINMSPFNFIALHFKFIQYHFVKITFDLPSLKKLQSAIRFRGPLLFKESS